MSPSSTASDKTADRVSRDVKGRIEIQTLFEQGGRPYFKLNPCDSWREAIAEGEEKRVALRAEQMYSGNKDDERYETLVITFADQREQILNLESELKALDLAEKQAGTRSKKPTVPLGHRPLSVCSTSIGVPSGSFRMCWMKRSASTTTWWNSMRITAKAILQRREERSSCCCCGPEPPGQRCHLRQFMAVRSTFLDWRKYIKGALGKV